MFRVYKERRERRKKRSDRNQNAVSLSALTWQRFKKERQAIVSLAYIGLVVVIAILGYLITPDSTPFSNH